MKQFFTILTIAFAVFFTGSASAQKLQQAVTHAFGQPIPETSFDPETGLVRCVTDEYEAYLQQKYPERKSSQEFEQWLAPLIEQYKNSPQLQSQQNGIITIPVVVHVIHNGQPIGTAPNITDAQVISQITVLNNDYRRMLGTPGYNNNPVGADTMIQFALAKQDPNGNPTNGINRVNLCQPSWSMGAIDDVVKPATIWDPSSYLNMWSVRFSNNGLLGYAQFPSGSGLTGLNNNMGPANTDGVVSDFATFGSIAYNDGSFMLNAPFNRGRTMTHEVGHWLGLIHIFGNGDCGNDFCADTPVHQNANYGCPVNNVSCVPPTLEMPQNYMDYTNDSCMNIFTQNQKTRMTVVMNNATRRASLKTSTKEQEIPLFPNDAELKLEANCDSGAAGCDGAPISVRLTNRGTSALTSATIQYSVAGSTPQTYNWTGNLAQHQFALVSIPAGNLPSGALTVSVLNANGTADQRASNNTATGTFTGGNVSYDSTQYTFTLQLDAYGSETTWQLRNQDNVVLYSGGNYPNTVPALPAPIVQTWTLPADGCYTFTINDAYNDGICCQYGPGSFQLRDENNQIVFQGASFGASQSKSFAKASLSTISHDMLSEVFVYPNPSTTSITVAWPDSMALPDSVTLVNSIGQTLYTKAVNNTDALLLDTSGLSHGIYFITVEKDGQRKTLRFAKQ